MSTQTGNHPEDKDIVDHVLRGDHAAFGRIIKNTEGLVAAIVCKMVPGTEDRKDIAQEVYLKAFHKLAGFKFQCKLSTWIGQIAYNTCLSWLDKKKLVLPDPSFGDNENHEDPLDSLSNRQVDLFASKTVSRLFEKQRSAIINAAMEKLSPVYKTMIHLYHQQELSYTEMAELTSLPEGTVKSYLFRARKALKDQLLLHYKKEEL